MNSRATYVVFGVIAAAIVVCSWLFMMQSENEDRIATPTQHSPIVAEVLANIRAQPAGLGTVGDHDLPEDFLLRVADRIICESFEDSFRIVVGNQPQRQEVAGDGEVSSDSVRIVERAISNSIKDAMAQVAEQIPPLAGYRAPILGAMPVPFELLTQDASQNEVDAATIVAKRLAKDGLLYTMAQAIAALGADQFQTADEAAITRVMQRIGLPVDLLESFTTDGRSGAFEIGRWIADQLSRGTNIEKLRAKLEMAQFSYKSQPKPLRIAVESGELAVESIRMQLTRGDYWDGIGDGGNVDIARQLAANLPDANFVVSIHRSHAEQFLETSRDWSLQRNQLTLIVEDFAVSQWAQDNGKACFDDDGNAVIVAPRFASRGEAGSVFVPGESFAMDGVAASGVAVQQSSLLFQGGNLLAVHDPNSNQRILLIGEAEIYRNRQLGLTEKQILDAFRVQFGVDRCEPLSTASFHLDYDVTVRAHDGRLIAFVNDSHTGSKIVLQQAIKTMAQNELLDAATAERCVQHLIKNETEPALQIIDEVMAKHAVGAGRYPLHFAKMFSQSEVDSGVGNLHRILVAMDTLKSTLSERASDNVDAPTREYFGALRRRAHVQAILRERLAAIGFEVVAVPALVGGKRGIFPCNGVQAQGMYLMAAYGGLFEPLDHAAQTVFEQTLGPGVKVIPITSGESQRRHGAVHCSVGVSYQSH